MSVIGIYSQLRQSAAYHLAGADYPSRVVRSALSAAALGLSLAFGSENGEDVAVYISEVGNPVAGRDLVRFRGEGDSLRGQVLVGCSYGLHLKDNLGCSSDVRRRMNMSAT